MPRSSETVEAPKHLPLPRDQFAFAASEVRDAAIAVVLYLENLVGIVERLA
jgi:hypothetical protein